MDHETELSRALLAARSDAGLTQVQARDATAAVNAKVSQAQLSRIERAQAVPDDVDLEALLRVYATPAERAERIRQLARAARGHVRDERLVIQRGTTLAMQRRWRELEENATVVRSFQPVLVLGALQTADYAAVAMQRPADSDEVLERQRRRDRRIEDGRRLVLLQTEGSLRQTVGSRELMADQLDAILEASRAPSVDLGVLPERTPLPLLVTNAFHLYDDHTVVVGLHVAAGVLDAPRDIAEFRGLFDRLAGLAAWDDEARVELTRLRELYRKW